MDIANTIDRLLSPVEKYGTVMGAGLGALHYLGGLKDSTSRLFSGQVHMPEVGNIITEILGSQEVKSSAIAVIAGYLLKGATGNKTISKIGEITQKVGTGYLTAAVVAYALWYSTHSPVYPKGGAEVQGSSSAYRGSTLGSRPTAGGAYGTSAPSRIIGN